MAWGQRRRRGRAGARSARRLTYFYLARSRRAERGAGTRRRAAAVRCSWAHAARREEGPRAKAQSFAPICAGSRILLRNRALVLLSTGSAFRTMTQSALLTFLPVYLAHDMGYSPFWVGACLFALQAAGLRRLADRRASVGPLGRKQILIGSMLATAVVLAAMAFSGGSPLFIALVAVLGFFLYATRPVIQAWMLESTPKNMGGSSIGVLFGAQALGACDRAAARRDRRRPLWAARDLLFPRGDHRRRQPVRRSGAQGMPGLSSAQTPRVESGVGEEAASQSAPDELQRQPISGGEGERREKRQREELPNGNRPGAGRRIKREQRRSTPRCAPGCRRRAARRQAAAPGKLSS